VAKRGEGITPGLRGLGSRNAGSRKAIAWREGRKGRGGKIGVWASTQISALGNAGVESWGGFPIGELP